MTVFWGEDRDSRCEC